MNGNLSVSSPGSVPIRMPSRLSCKAGLPGRACPQLYIIRILLRSSCATALRPPAIPQRPTRGTDGRWMAAFRKIRFGMKKRGTRNYIPCLWTESRGTDEPWNSSATYRTLSASDNTRVKCWRRTCSRSVPLASCSRYSFSATEDKKAR